MVTTCFDPVSQQNDHHKQQVKCWKLGWDSFAGILKGRWYRHSQLQLLGHVVSFTHLKFHTYSTAEIWEFSKQYTSRMRVSQWHTYCRGEEDGVVVSNLEDSRKSCYWHVPAWPTCLVSFIFIRCMSLSKHWQHVTCHNTIYPAAMIHTCALYENV